VSFLLEIGEIVAGLGREVEVDTTTSTLTVESDLPEQPRLLVVVRQQTQAVTFYATHPRTVPAERLADVAELVVRATGNEFTAALELDYDNRTVTTRAGLELFGTVLSGEETEALLAVLLVELESVARCYGPAVDAVVAGELTPAVAAESGQSARRQERFDEASQALDEASSALDEAVAALDADPPAARTPAE